jgi:hypothetical protein
MILLVIFRAIGVASQDYKHDHEQEQDDPLGANLWNA